MNSNKMSKVLETEFKFNRNRNDKSLMVWLGFMTNLLHPYIININTLSRQAF